MGLLMEDINLQSQGGVKEEPRRREVSLPAGIRELFIGNAHIKNNETAGEDSRPKVQSEHRPRA